MSQTIVCIDDEAHNNEALERLLRRKYKVLTSTQPLEGLELIKEHQPALIISDQRMPQMMGVELLKKSVELSPNSLRILLTGYTDLESVIAAINEGEIYRYITKPWDTNDLTITIDKAIETHQLQQEIQRQNKELQSLDRLKTDFMLMVTHELRTPITGISSFTALLKEELTDKNQLKYISHIEKNSDRMQKLIEDILMITKLKSEVARISVETIDPKNLFISLWADKARTDLELQIHGDEIQWIVNSQHIKEIFLRLIENCNSHAKKSSKVHLQLQKENQSFSLSNETEKPLPQDRNSLLSSFTTNENIMNHSQGTGLGLAVVKALTDALQGQLLLEGEGQTFTALLQFPNKAL